MSVTLFLNNRSPTFFDTIRIAGVAMDLTGSTVALRMRAEGSSTLVIDAAETIGTASTTLSATTSLPEPSITVASTTGFLANGALTVGGQIIEYEEISGNAFLGCSGGEGSVAAAAAVTQRGGVTYPWAAADVDAAGDFLAWHRVTLPGGNVQETPDFQVFILDPTQVSLGLCELADVLSYAPGYKPNAQTEALLERLILSETRDIQRETGREVRAITPVLDPRRFDLVAWNVRERKVRIGDLVAAPTTVKIIDSDQATVLQTVAAADYVLLPRVRDSWEPITGLYFPPNSPNAATLAMGYVVEVDAAATGWGFVTVPDDLREACASRVIFRYVSNSATRGTSFSEALAEVNIGALFANAQSVVEGYSLALVA